MCGSIKDVLDARVGDTICLSKEYKATVGQGSKIEPLPGYADSVPMVYCGLFPVDADDYESLRDSLGKLRLNDAALSYEPESSGAWDLDSDVAFWDSCTWRSCRNVFSESTTLISL